MEKVCISGEIAGRIESPSSKSAMQRAVACALLADGRSEISFSGSPCADSQAAGRVAAALGATLEWAKDRLTMYGSPLFSRQSALTIPDSENPDEAKILECGESGLCMRMFSPLASLLDRKIIMMAEGSLALRPMAMMEAPFAQAGVSCRTDSGHPPVELKGPLRGGRIFMDAGGSSQFLTGLLMALAFTSKGGEVELTNPVSMGYLDLTAEMCGYFGVKIGISEDHRHYAIPGGQIYRPASIRIEGDWSSGAFLAVAAALASRKGLMIGGLDPLSSQPDRAILPALLSAGSRVEFLKDQLRVVRDRLVPFVFDATQCPDLFPPLAVLAAAADGVSVLKGISRLKGKESDRALSIQRCLENLGICVDLGNDEMRIRGGSIHGGKVDACRDHRIAMAAATAAITASGPVTIIGSECVGKSWPGFYQDLDSIRS